VFAGDFPLGESGLFVLGEFFPPRGFLKSCGGIFFVGGGNFYFGGALIFRGKNEGVGQFVVPGGFFTRAQIRGVCVKYIGGVFFDTRFFYTGAPFFSG